MSYLSEHPTHFNFTAPVSRAVKSVQKKFPWATFANTYYDHPPGFGRRYERVSVDFWGGGRSGGRYTGYRGKPLPRDVGNKVFNDLYYRGNLQISWIIWQGRMWVRGKGWGPAPGGPIDSDPGHYRHIHCTFVG